MKYLGYIWSNLGVKSITVMDQVMPILHRVSNEKGDVVRLNFKGTENEFKELVLVDKFNLETSKLYKECMGIFTLGESYRVYLEGDFIGSLKLNGKFTFNNELSDRVKENLAQKLQKVFKDCREYNESLQLKRKEIEDSAKKELEERILKNLEKWNYK